MFQKNNQKLIRLMLAAGVSFPIVLGCQQKAPEADKTVIGTGTPGPNETVTAGAWLDTSFVDPVGAVSVLASKDLAVGGPRDSLSMTYSRANSPIALFRASARGDDGTLNDVPYLSWTTEDRAAVTIRHIKSVNGQNILSQLVLPQECPELMAKVKAPGEGKKLYCLPLINQVVPNFLVSSDNSGAYVHEFVIGLKHPNKSAGVLSAKIAFRIVIPGSVLAVSTSDDMKGLTLAERVTMATNDLIGSPRRDFKAFEVKGAVAPGVQTSWVLTLSNVKMTIEEEVFFEQPVIPGEKPAKPLVSRGAAFYKRKSSVNSWDHFRVRIGSPDGSQSYFNVASGNRASVIEIPIDDGTKPLRVFLSPDFASETAVKSMYEYVRPFSPTFCPKEQASFKPEEWRQSRLSPSYVACEAAIRKRIVDAADAARKGVTSPMETYFGSFAYLPRLAGSVLGGTNGVLSLRVSLSGKLVAAVRNPHNPATTTTVGEIDLASTYQFPTALYEMDKLIKTGLGTPGLDTILTAMQRKGVLELPRRSLGTKPAFPFQSEDRDDVLY